MSSLFPRLGLFPHGLPESNTVFALSPLNSSTSVTVTSVPVNGGKIAGFQKEFAVDGDVYMVKVECLDMALWKIGGISFASRLVQVANVSGAKNVVLCHY